MAKNINIRSGAFRHRLAVQKATETENDDGSVSKAWATEDTRWGSIQPLSGTELLDAQKIESETTHRIRMRYYSGLETTDRITNDPRTFHIISIINVDDLNWEHELMCKEDTT